MAQHGLVRLILVTIYSARRRASLSRCVYLATILVLFSSVTEAGSPESWWDWVSAAIYPPSSSFLPPALLALARAQPKGFVNEHNGMIFHYDQTHRTIPPHASNATFGAAEACVCSDADPRDDTQLVTTTCFHQRVFGNCEAEFMMGALEELVETDGFCQMSCGRCQCCDTPANIIAKTGWGDSFLEYAASVPGFMELLQHPGMLGTLLVPTDEAWEALEEIVPPAVLRSPALVEQILKLHWIPPEPRTRGLWTTPFLSTGSRVYTASDAPVWLETRRKTLPAGTTMYGGLTGIAIRGPVNQALIQDSDLRACKLLIDSVNQ
ncbi:hypothetical protein H632_c969p0, partial [Helicosporidium sp. ATCC 50920]